ncbi:DUF1365 domain-containing protein [Rheinheimera salexigens]|uniref:DUF1365 domain-containing protein n=1 Tax=Rheinheimera salexigens TaxID=1628148 RepID=A0A1E7Q702_9GAMM|nr:DUF1365 domain-containing protein [Rheinheimera salexigens]OEY69853.1 hypothetical protein BI198_09980 [Rheinheimera salexigens]
MQAGHAVYQGVIGHKRFVPSEHGFSYRLSQFWLDSALLNKADLATVGISLNRFAALSYRRRDYLAGAENIFQAVCDKVMLLSCQATPEITPQTTPKSTTETTIVKVFILTPLANYGVFFSPLTLYYCYDIQHRLRYLLAEVSNTPWNERHYYLQTIQQKQRHYKHDKAFHVSPFNPIDMQYHWQITPPNNTLLCQITNFSQQQKVFSAWLKLYRYDLTKTWRRQWLIRTPWQNVQNLMRIYWHALRLLIKRVPIHHHPGTKDNNA